uniref:Group II intron maturase-specific domain-containing protein n=1 Tax=Dichotomosiphon tuberosus TaxID=118263 RepID=A0A386AWW7_9CHLO|nr:hypothetical protein [Dichotomosiphon tuberosus]
MSNKNLIKYIPWRIYSKKLLKIQYKIYISSEEKKNRKIRNLSRLIIRSKIFKLIIINQILKYQFSQNYSKNIPDYFKQLNISKIQIEFLKLTEPEYKKLIKIKIYEILWILALLPIVEYKKINSCLSSNINENNKNIYLKFYSIFKNSSIEWIGINKIQNFLSKENKIWILNNILIEKKFFINWLTYNNNSLNNYSYYLKDKIYLIKENYISLYKILYNFTIIEIIDTLKSNFNLNKISIIEYANILIILSNNSYKLILIQNLLKKKFILNGLKLKTYHINNLYNGFNFLGWNFSKKNDKIECKISKENIRSHQIEIKKYLKSTINTPVDKVIFQLNKKIFLWQKYYCYSMKLNKIYQELNNYLFCRIWRWIKKRHRNKGIKWLYKYYWTKNKSNNKYIFYNNNQYLLLYKKNKIYNYKKLYNFSSKDKIKEYWKNQLKKNLS